MGKAGILVAWIVCALARGAWAQPAVPLVSAAAVHALSDAEARRSVPVHLRAVVTYYDPRTPEIKKTSSLFVQDKSGGIFVALPLWPALVLPAGTLVEVTGVTASGDFAPIVGEARVKVLGKASTPKNPPRVTMMQMATGVYDCDWVEVSGFVHRAMRVGRMETLRIATRDGLLTAETLARKGVDNERWVGAQVRVRGVAAVDYNKRRQMTGIHLFFPDEHELRVLRPAAGDAFSLPVRTVNRLASFDPQATVTERVHLRGSVTLDWPGRLLCVQDASGGLCVEHGGEDRFALGSVVDVVGYPVFAAEVPALTDASVRRSGAESAAVPARKVDAAEVFEGEHSGEMLAIEGTLVGVGSDEKTWLLTFASKGVVFTATLPRSVALDAQWREGSYVRVVGVCVDEMEPQAMHDWSSLQRLRSFRLLMRSGADVTMLRRPTWWSGAHVLEVFSFGLVVTLAGFGWVVLLRRRVEEKTQALRASEERFKHLALHDPLTGVPNRARFYDRAGRAIEHALRSGSYVGVMLLDMDNFKPINDTLGHEAGDRVLCALTERVSAALRKVDTVARLGGDEFAVVLCDLHEPGDAELVAQKVLEAVCRPLEVQGQVVAMSVSIGVCVFPGDGGSVPELLQNADRGMYESKRARRGGIRRFRREGDEVEDAELVAVSGLS